MKLFIILILACFVVFPKTAAAQEAQSNVERIKFGNPATTQSGACWPTNGRVSQGPQGGTSHNNIYNGSGDESLDISALPFGTNPPVYATFEGTVTAYDCTGAGNCVGGYGNMIQLKPDSHPGASILHGHLSSISVSNGSSVTPGQQLGIMGTTGHSSGVHLHWEFEGLALAPPNIPQEIPSSKRTCDSEVACAITMDAGPASCSVTTSTQTVDSYWFVLHRKSNTEELYKGVPGNKNQSTVVKTFSVKTGRPNERPTPLPQLLGREYWIITEAHPETSNPETAPYFLTLDVPGIHTAPYGPVPYNECAGQCDWVTPGAFGLHGVGGNSSKLSSSDPGSSGCIRHTDADITYLYNLLDFSKGGIRYYVEDN